MSHALWLSMLTFVPSANGDDLARDIVANKHKKIGVIPTVIYRRGDHEATVSPLGPRGKVIASSIYESLIHASQHGTYKGQFQVVPERVMRSALRSRSLDDLSSPQKLQELAKEVGGADSFLISSIDEDLSDMTVRNVGVGRGFDDDQPNKSNTTDAADGDDKEQGNKNKAILTQKGSSEVVDVKQGVVDSQSKFSDDLTLSKAAYQGYSWELRRWNGNQLENRGIDLSGNMPFGLGASWEKEQWAHLKPDLKHPHADSTFPYPVSVKVSGAARDPVTVEDKRVIELNQDEEFRIALGNDTDKGVYVALYIDGLNSINRLRVEPDQLELMNHWHLPAHQKIEIEGWHDVQRNASGKRIGTPTVSLFRIVGRGESVAAGNGFEDNIGVLTAIFYTVGMDHIEQPPAGRGLPNSVVGVGEGARSDASISSFRQGDDRGLMLAAWTFHYRTKDQIKEIQAGTSNDLAMTGHKGDGVSKGKNEDSDHGKDQGTKEKKQDNSNDDEGLKLDIGRGKA